MFAGQAFDINVPKGLKPGIYILSTALFPPETDNYGSVRYNIEPKFASRTNAIALKRVPIVVGKVAQAFEIQNLYIDGYSDSVLFESLDNPNVNFSVSFNDENYLAFSSPEKEFFETRSTRGWNFNLPRENGEADYTFQTAHFDKTGNVDWYSAVPIQRRLYNKEYNVYQTRMGAPNLDFPANLIKYRENLESNIKEFCLTNQAASAKTIK